MTIRKGLLVGGPFWRRSKRAFVFPTYLLKLSIICVVYLTKILFKTAFYSIRLEFYFILTTFDFSWVWLASSLSFFAMEQISKGFFFSLSRILSLSIFYILSKFWHLNSGHPIYTDGIGQTYSISKKMKISFSRFVSPRWRKSPKDFFSLLIYRFSTPFLKFWHLNLRHPISTLIDQTK